MPSYLSLGFRFAAFPYGEGAEHSEADEVNAPPGHHSPLPLGRGSGWHALHFVCACLSFTGLSVRSLPPWGAEPAAAGGRNLIRLASRSTFPIGEGKAGGSVVSKEASQAPPARCEATIANLTEAKQEVAARRADG